MSSTAVPAQLTFAEVLRIDVMRRLWYAQIVSLFGDFLALFAVISVVSFRMHGTPNQITWVQIAYMLPLVVLGPLSGVFVDRWPLKTTLVSSDLIRACLALGLVFSTRLWHVYLVLMGISAVSSFFSPAQSVTIRSHVPRHGLLAANSLMQLVLMGIRIVGPATAGVLVAAFGPSLCYSLDVVSFVVSASLIASVAIHRGLAAAPESRDAGISKVRALWNDMLQGMRFIGNHAAVLFVVLAMAAGLFTIGCFGPLIAIFVRESLHGSASVFGLVSGMVGVGLMVGTQGIRSVAARATNESMVLVGLAGIGGAVLLLGAAPHIAATFAATFLIGLSFAGIIVPAQTLLQQETPHELMGRISSTVMSIVFLAQLLGLMASGVLAQLVGVRAVFFVCAVIATALALAGHWFLTRGGNGAGQPAAVPQ